MKRGSTTSSSWKKILADPSDLDLRHVFADELLDHNDPLGEYQQLELALAELDAQYVLESNPKRATLTRRAAELRSRHLLAWTRAIAGVPGLPRRSHTPSFRLRRGLVEELVLDAHHLPVLHAAARVAPIRALTLADADAGWLARLAQMPELAHVRRLALRADHEDDVLTLLASPYLVRLERVEIGAPMSARLAKAMASSEACAQLSELELRNHPGGEGLGPDGAAALKDLPLASLCLSAQRLGPPGVTALASLRTLRSLTLIDEAVGPAGARILVGAKALANLRVLALRRCALAPEGLKAIAGAAHLGKLRALELGDGNGLNAKTTAALLEAWTLELDELTLDGPIRTEGAAAMVRSEALLNLRALTIHGLGDHGVVELSRLAPERLERVDLARNTISVHGMAALAEGPLLAHARSLRLDKNKCQNEGGRALAKAPWLHQLRELSLYYNWIGVFAAREILENMPKAEVLHLGENNYGSEPLRVAARGLLPALHTLDLGGTAERATLERWLSSGHANRLRSLSIHAVTLTPEIARLLCALPTLERLHFSFCSFEGGVMETLEERLAGLITFWPEEDAGADAGPAGPPT